MDHYTAPDLYENQFEENKRPGFLTFLCILTFIGSGLSLLSHLLSPIVAPLALEIMRESSFASIPGMIEAYEQILEVPVWQFYVFAFCSATSIIGAVYMMKMKKIGFHLYTIAQLAILFISQFVVGGNLKPKISDLLITLVFIGLYAMYYKKFVSLETQDAESME